MEDNIKEEQIKEQSEQTEQTQEVEKPKIEKSLIQRPQSKKRKFVADGIRYCELNELLKKELEKQGYASVEIRPTSKETQIVIEVMNTREAYGEKGVRIAQLQGVIEQRFGFKKGEVKLAVKKLQNRSLCPAVQAENIKAKILAGSLPRSAATFAMRQIMNGGATGCEVIISGTTRSRRAKTNKYRDGYMKKSGEPKRTFLKSATRCAHMKQGVIGVQVKIMLPFDPTDKHKSNCPTKPIPDVVVVNEVKESDELPEGASPTSGICLTPSGEKYKSNSRSENQE